MNGDAAEEHLTSLLVARDEALAAGRETPRDEVPPELRPRLDRALAALQLLHEARPRGQALATAGEPSTGPDPELPASAPPALPDHFGRFRIIRELGRGGFGIVFLAHDPRLDREVALKVPRLDALLTADLRDRFHQEARVAAGLDHPSIVAVHEAGEAGPVCYIASAYCPGPTLAAWLKAQTAPVPPADAAGLVATLAEAVHYAHCRGVLHRDLKPANVLLTGERRGVSPPVEDGRADAAPLAGLVPRITDFGLAKLIELAADTSAPEVRTRSGTVLGTAAYMAPEQGRGKRRDLGPAVDVYALGAILYELLTGRPPFVGETDLEVCSWPRTRNRCRRAGCAGGCRAIWKSSV